MARRRTPGDSVTAGRVPCRSQLNDCRERLRSISRELEAVRAWMEANALRIDRMIAELAAYAGNASANASAGQPLVPVGCRPDDLRKPEPVLSKASVSPRGDGYFDVHIDELPVVQLPPTLGRLFQALAEDGGHTLNDGLVGFKSNARLLARLQADSMHPEPALRWGGRVNARQLTKAVHELRKRLDRVIADGAALVQTRRGVGRRLAVRR
ncbi:MAG: hypothetical protein HOP16_16330 [Acidobacteria bacterium]|nr:hypothetical protein [Acidobacteriota bacterium]